MPAGVNMGFDMMRMWLSSADQWVFGRTDQSSSICGGVKTGRRSCCPNQTFWPPRPKIRLWQFSTGLLRL